MRLATWNVNSLLARQERFLAFCRRQQPDVVCLQELKCEEERFPREFLQAELGMASYVWGQKRYNGVAILSKRPADEVQTSWEGNPFPDEARFIAARWGRTWIASVYAINGKELADERYQDKLRWYASLRDFLAARMAQGETWILAGDFNIAPTDQDVYDPAQFVGATHVSVPERGAFSALLDLGLVDLFRSHQAGPGHYSWWDYRALGFPLNKGLRIDMILAGSGTSFYCRSCSIEREERKGDKPSDHAPVIADFTAGLVL